MLNLLVPLVQLTLWHVTYKSKDQPLQLDSTYHQEMLWLAHLGSLLASTQPVEPNAGTDIILQLTQLTVLCAHLLQLSAHQPLSSKSA